MDAEDVYAALSRILRAASWAAEIPEIERASRPLRHADAWLREDVAADFLGVAERTIADLCRSGVPFDARERHRQWWFRRAGPVVDGRGSLESYVSGEIGPA